MENTTKQEVWLRGSLPEVPALLQPVAHALLQAREEINAMLRDFPKEKLWEKVAGMASVGFHLQHMRGVMDRLTTYADGRLLSEDQLQYLRSEGSPTDNLAGLLQAFNLQVDKAIVVLKSTDENTLTEPRGVGRAQLPSTVIGLLVHMAEHTMRHTGQLLVTVKVLNPS
ncbi:DinB family protein [Mucilaginibacter yixingensis]|uniref:DinB family protein n=1 Tax=Mucilaginibacter yixingensis TaxID=1295612 RepID=A0A2T5J675_9SPHI|nr:DinB family protein [Mucilaginibacter yixingensis]PTQ94033.1 DinB family protein [Mucilaginibacter yixingensis]